MLCNEMINFSHFSVAADHCIYLYIYTPRKCIQMWTYQVSCHSLMVKSGVTVC